MGKYIGLVVTHPGNTSGFCAKARVSTWESIPGKTGFKQSHEWCNGYGRDTAEAIANLQANLMFAHDFLLSDVRGLTEAANEIGN